MRDPKAFFGSSVRTARHRSLPPLESVGTSPSSPSKGQNRQLEQAWDERFFVSYSKDNDKCHWLTREYFDVPKSPVAESLYVTALSPVKTPTVKGHRHKAKRQSLGHWYQVYFPLSMLNTHKHPGLRTYF